MAGNGGKMAEEKKQLKKTRKRSTAGSRAVEKPRKKAVARSKNATTRDSPVAGAGERAELNVTADPNVNGEKKLRDSVNQQVAKKAGEIAKELVAGAAKGNAACTKLVLELMSGKKQVAKSRSSGLSKLIDVLEREPEWVKPETNDTKQT